MITIKITKDGELQKEFKQQSDDFLAFKYLIDKQGNSIHHAVRHEGWDVELIDEDTGEKQFYSDDFKKGERQV